MADQDLSTVYAALQKADAAGDKAAAQQLADYIRTKNPGGAPAGPAGQTAKPPQKPSEPTFRDYLAKGAKAWGEAVAAPLEAGASMLTGAIAKPVSDIAGMAAAGHDMLTGNQRGDPEGFKREVQERLTYQPRTEMGKETVSTIGAIGDATIGSVGRAVGTLAGQGATALGASQDVSEATQRGVTEAVEQAPNIIGARGASKLAQTGGAAGAPLSTVARQAAETRAKDYVRTRAGVDWDRLPQTFKDTITKIAEDPKRLADLPPDAIKRQAQLQALPIPVETTRAKLTRNPADVRREGNVAATDAGKPIQDIDVKSNEDLKANLEVLRGRAAGLQGPIDQPGLGRRAAVRSREEIGQGIQGEVKLPNSKDKPTMGLRYREQLSKDKYNELYKRARETEPDARVPGEPLHELLNGRPDIQHLGFVDSWMRREGIKTLGPEGEVQIGDLNARELQDLREEAGGIAANGGTDGFYGAKVVRAIDKAMEAMPEAAKNWKAAQKAFAEHKTKFEDQAAVDKLTGMKSRTDPNVALEKTIDTIRTTSLEGIRQIKRTLTEGGTMAQRLAGKKALRDIRAGVMDDILTEANKVVGTDKAGSTSLTASKLRAAIDRYGRPKLEELIGKSNTEQLYNILEATKIVKTDPVTRASVGSSTVQNVLTFMEKFHVPFIKHARGLGESIKDLGGAGEARRVIDEARSDPLTEASNRLDTQQRRMRRGAAAQTAAPAFTIGEHLQNEQQNQ